MEKPFDTETYANDSATSSSINTELAQPRSGFDLEDTRRALIATRVKHGADTPIGHRCSNIVECLEGGAPAALIARQMTDLQRLLGSVQ